MCYHASLTGSYFRITDYNDIQAQPQLELWGHGVHVCVCVYILVHIFGFNQACSFPGEEVGRPA